MRRAALLAIAGPVVFGMAAGCASGPNASSDPVPSPVTTIARATDAATVDSAESVLREIAGGTVGVAVAVVRAGEPVWLAGAGAADRVSGARVDPSTTRFRIYSVTKPMTAVAALRLAGAGRLDPGAPVTRYVPGLPETFPPVTALQLGTHTSGIRHYADEAEARDPGRCETAADALPIFIDDPLVQEPGAEESYSSWGFVLLSAIIAAVADRPFPAAMEALVFSPAHMEGMAVDDPDVELPRRATPYERAADGALGPAPVVDNTCKWGAGGFVGTAEDVGRFGAALVDGTLVPERGLQMFLRGSGSYTARGTGAGGTAVLRVDESSSTAIALLTNTSGVGVGAALDRGIAALAELFELS